MLIFRWMKRFELNRPHVLGLFVAHLLLILLVILLVLGAVPVSAHAAARTLLANDYTQKTRLLPDGQAPLSYFGQAVAVSADGRTMLVSAPGENGTTGAVYVYTKATSDGSWVLQTKIQGTPPNNTTDFPSFGSALAISADGNTALIASRYEAGWQGAVYVYVRTNTSWALQSRLVANIAANGDYFGSAVALSADGGTALIGAEASNDFNGSAFVFMRSGSTWQQLDKLVPTDAAQYENTFYGHSVALSGNGKFAVVGAPYQGAAYVYQLAGANWSLQQKIINAYIGDAVSFASDGSSLLVSAIGADGFRGAAYIYGTNGTTWTQQAQLTVNNLPGYAKLGQTAAFSADGNTAILGADAKTSAYVFKKSNTGWSLSQQISPTDSTSNEGFGSGLALSGDGTTALIGAPNRGAGNNVGAAYIFERTVAAPPNSYTQKNKFLPVTQSAQAGFGQGVAVSTDGLTMLVGAPLENGSIGAAYTYRKVGGVWKFDTKLAGDTPENPGGFVSFGNAVALSADGKTALVASGYENGAKGAVYVFARNAGNWSRQAKLVANGLTAGDAFGSMVTLSADGKTALISAAGYDSPNQAAYIFTRSENTWTQQTKFLPTEVAANKKPAFGRAISLSSDGKLAVVGAPDQGATYVYRLGNTGWSQEQKLTHTSPFFGNSVSFTGDGSTLAVGAIDTTNWRGLGYIYTKNGATWTQQSQLAVDSISSFNYLGVVLEISKNGSTIVFGTETEYVYVFKKNGSEWKLFQRLTPNDFLNQTYFGRAVALSGNGSTLVAGAPNQAVGVGAVYVFQAPTPSLTLSVNNSSSVEGREVIFSAHLTDAPADAKVAFIVDGTAGVAPTAITDNGTTFQYATNFALGKHTISASYQGADSEAPLTTETVPHLVTTLCDGVLVTLATDDGSGSVCGSLSRAIKNAATIDVSTPMITFALEDATQIKLTGQANLVIPANVVIDGGTNVVLNGNNQAGDGLVLSGNNSLKGLTIKGFAGRELVLKGLQNVFEHVVVLP